MSVANPYVPPPRLMAAPNMRICQGKGKFCCNQEKPLNEFSGNKQYCNGCYSAYVDDNDPERKRQRRLERSRGKKATQVLQEQKASRTPERKSGLALRGGQCEFVGCGCSDIRCLDADHIDPTTKSPRLLGPNKTNIWALPLDELKTELLKCRLLCTFHHSMVTKDWREANRKHTSHTIRDRINIEAIRAQVNMFKLNAGSCHRCQRPCDPKYLNAFSILDSSGAPAKVAVNINHKNQVYVQQVLTNPQPSWCAPTVIASSSGTECSRMTTKRKTRIERTLEAFCDCV